MVHVSRYMTIGIDASRAFQKNKTGIEEYSYQTIKHLRDYLGDKEVILYLNSKINKREYLDFDLPKNWKLKNLRAPILWTQIRLSIEMLLHPPDVLFVSAHTVPAFHPRNTVATIHGLEYEFCPQAYSFYGRLYMRWSIRKSCRWAKRIIAVSENTKKDLIKLYNVSKNKITVIYEGYDDSKSQFLNPNSQRNTKYLLFVGRLEERKNIIGIIEAFEILKKKYNVPHKLVLAGKFGYGGDNIKSKIENSEYGEDIILPGYISDEEKRKLMKNAELFLFPTFYEGFGLPILEAQVAGIPVITSNISSMPEVAGEGALFVDPGNPENIAEAVYGLISDESKRNGIIKKGKENAKRFSWDKCAREIAGILIAMNGKNK